MHKFVSTEHQQKIPYFYNVKMFKEQTIKSTHATTLGIGSLGHEVVALFTLERVSDVV